MPGPDPKFLAWLYDETMQDWPGELDFYLQLAQELPPKSLILEVGCGTGRVAIHLAKHGFTVTGTDISEAMLELARQKCQSLPGVHWFQADMKALYLKEQFALAVIPGHSFQFMLTAEDQFNCLNGIRAGLASQGRLVIHVNHDDLSWLASLPQEPGTQFEAAGEVPLPDSGHILRTRRAWSYECLTQTATSVSRREEVDAAGKVVNSWLSEPIRLHCLFPTEFEHLAQRAGFTIETRYGDFYKSKLREDSDSMIFVLRNQG